MRYKTTNLEFLKQELAKLSDDLSLPWNTYPCLEWPRGRSHGYGSVADENGYVGAHRIAYRLYRGEILPGYEACHFCDFPACFRPIHLFPGTQADNILDAIAKGRLDTRGPRSLISGELHYCAKLKAADIPRIFEKFASGMNCGRIALDYGVSHAAIRKVINGKSWRYVNDLEKCVSIGTKPAPR